MSAALSGWAIEALIASTLLMIGVLLVRTPARRLFGPQVAYALWALPALRLLLPSMPQGWRAIATPISRAGETIAVYVIEPAGTAPGATMLASARDYPAFGPTIGLLAAVIWGAGATAFLLWHLVRHTRFCARMVNAAERLDDQQGVRVIASAAAPGPLAFGVVRRYVAFPQDFAERYDAEERELALAHELGHHQRGDLIANWAALVILALHWFNPIAWRAFRTFRADQELANDARVLAGRSAVDRHIYACAIVKAAHGGALSAACHLHTITDLKGRLKMLTTARTSRRRLATGSVSVVALVAAGLGLTASGTSAAEAVAARIRTDIQVEPPAPPVPPLPAAESVPPVPPVPPVAVREAHDGKTRTRIVRVEKGDRIAVPSAPEVTERACADGSDGDPRQVVVDRKEGDKRIMIICSNRIDKAAAEGAEVAANSKDIQRAALRSAIAGLRTARAVMASTMTLPPEARAQAVAGLDQGIAEAELNLAKED